MTHQPVFFSPTLVRGSSYNAKRKTYDDSDDEAPQQPSFRVKSPPLKRRATFPAPHALQMPELMTDCSNSASNSDEDMAMDQDGDMDMDGPQHVEDDRGFVPRYDYEYGMSGSGGIGFGPGAEEDEEFMDEHLASDKSSAYPSLTPHTNPNHFSNNAPFTSNTLLPFANPNSTQRASSPLSAQPFATTLRAPAGVFQPVSNGPVAFGASEIEKARSVHGPQCKSIPKLVISPHADISTGKQAMYTMCPDCGSCERAA